MAVTLEKWTLPSENQTPSQPRWGPHRRVLIVGGGVAGVATAKTFLHASPATPPENLLVLESHSSVGGVWADGKAYPGLASNGPRGLYGGFGPGGHPFHSSF